MTAKRKKTINEHPELGLPEVKPLWETVCLFSDHYLKDRVHRNIWWPSDDETRHIWEFCRDLYNLRYLGCAKGPESETRQELLKRRAATPNRVQAAASPSADGFLVFNAHSDE